MVRLCFALLLLRKEQDGIHKPRGFMDDLKGEVIGEKVNAGGLWEDILSADLNCEDAFSMGEVPRPWFSSFLTNFTSYIC